MYIKKDDLEKILPSSSLKQLHELEQSFHEKKHVNLNIKDHFSKQYISKIIQYFFKGKIGEVILKYLHKEDTQPYILLGQCKIPINKKYQQALEKMEYEIEFKKHQYRSFQHIYDNKVSIKSLKDFIHKKKYSKTAFDCSIYVLENLKKNRTQKNLPYVLILAGGSGTRLWPLSTTEEPKQLLALSSSKSLIEETIQRALLITDESHIFIGTNAHLKKKIKAQIKKLKNKNFIIEPTAKNTAPIIAYFCSMLYQKKYDINQPLVVLSADHYIPNNSLWLENIKQILPYQDKIWCIGIPPERAETGYGYIQTGSTLYDDNLNLLEIQSFKEKPNQEKALLYLKSKSYLWNIGMFIFTPKLFLEEAKKYAPEIYDLSYKCTENSTALQTYFEKMPSISVDYAIMERSKTLGVLKANFKWDDLGSYLALERILDKDDNVNQSLNQTQVKSIDASHNLVYSKKKKIALLGVKELIIIEKNNTILIAHKNKIADIKKLI